MRGRVARAARYTIAGVRARADAATARKLWGRRVVVDDIATWARTRGLDVEVLSPAEVRRRRASIPVAGASEPNFEAYANNRPTERILVCIPGATLWGRYGLVILPDGSFSSESVYNREYLEELREFSIPRRSRVIEVDGDVFPLLGPFASQGNYYHWVHDGLLRLHGTEGRVPASARYVMPANASPWQLDQLEMVGVGRDRIDLLPRGRALACERLWFASLPPSGSTVRAAASWLRDRMWSAAGVDAPTPRRRLYLSRAATGHARVVNEEQIAPVLAGHGFEIVRPETQSVTEQVRLFAEAEAVVSATSSALTNLLFAGPTTRTLEILEPAFAERRAFVVWQFADALGLRHWYCTGESVPADGSARADLRVPPEMLDRALREMMA